MIKWALIVLLVGLPVLEIWGLVTVGRQIGPLPTALLLVLASVLGAYLAKREWTKVWHTARMQWQRGEVPAAAVLDGLCVFAGGLLLVVPGFFTDVVGLLMILPPGPAWGRRGLLRLFRRAVERGRFRFWYYR